MAGNMLFVGCPYHKGDIAKKLHKFYPGTPVAAFMKKKKRQLYKIYAETMKKRLGWNRGVNTEKEVKEDDRPNEI